MQSILRAIWQADGTFPGGAFAFSYGVEGAIALQGGIDRDGLRHLIATILRQRWATFDRVALLRAFRGNADIAVIGAIDREVEAATLVRGLREGSRRNGASFLASQARLGVPIARSLREAVGRGDCLGHAAVMQGAVWQAIGLDEDHAALASAYATASGIVAACVRLGAVGALTGQAALGDCLPVIEEVLADEPPEQMASFVPWLDIASARHARADLKLFAN